MFAKSFHANPGFLLKYIISFKSNRLWSDQIWNLCGKVTKSNFNKSAKQKKTDRTPGLASAIITFPITPFIGGQKAPGSCGARTKPQLEQVGAGKAGRVVIDGASTINEALMIKTDSGEPSDLSRSSFCKECTRTRLFIRMTQELITVSGGITGTRQTAMLSRLFCIAGYRLILWFIELHWKTRFLWHSPVHYFYSANTPCKSP